MISTTQNNLKARQQFEELFQKSRRRAFYTAYRLTQNATEAEDLTQDAYLRAWQHFDRFQTGSAFEPWLFAIITHRALDLMRRKKRVRMISLDITSPKEDDASPRIHEIADQTADPQQIMDSLLMEEGLERALRALPASHREAILLSEVEDWTYQEIAEKVGCPMGTVRSRIHRARNMLRHLLALETDLSNDAGGIGRRRLRRESVTQNHEENRNEPKSIVP